MSESGPDTLSQDLPFKLCEDGAVQRLEVIKAYIICPDPGGSSVLGPI
jgi:hypothetical protein